MNLFKNLNLFRPENKKLKPEKPESNRGLSDLLNSPGLRTFLAVALFAGCSNRINDKNTEPLSEKKHDGIEVVHEGEQRDQIRILGDAYHRFVYFKDGELSVNWWALIAPLQIEAGFQERVEKKDNFSIPYAYSRLFDTAESLSPESREKIVNFIEQEIKNRFAESLFILDPTQNSRATYEARHLESKTNDTKDELNVSSIRITGFASPEGPKDKGTATITQGNIDVENLSLAAKRSNDIYPLVLEALERQGVPVDDIKSEISVQEIQFTQQDLYQLAFLTEGLSVEGGSEMDKILNLIVNYNDGVYQDNPEVNKILNEIIASKRMVSVEVEFTNLADKKVVIPIPWFIFLLPLLFRRGRKKGSSSETKIKSEKPVEAGVVSGENKAVETAATMYTGKIIRPGTMRFEQSDQSLPELPLAAPLFVEDYLKTLDGLSKEVIADKEERAFLDDIVIFRNNPDTIRRGLSYDAIIEMMARDNSPESDEKDARYAQHILDKWIEHDVRARQDAGISEDELMAGLDYKNNPEQVQWAKLHVMVLKDLADVYRRGGPEAFDKALAEKISEFEKRRLDK